MFFESFNSGIEQLFKAYAKSKGVNTRNIQRKFDELSYTPYLHDSSYLLELSDSAASKDQQNMILDYLYRFNDMKVLGDDGPEHLDILGLSGYHKVEESIINKRWKV